MAASLWDVQVWEAAVPLLLVVGWAALGLLFTDRARRNRAKLRRQRLARRALSRASR